MSFQASLASLKKFTAGLRALPRTVSQKVAARSAPGLSAAARQSFAASEDPFGIPWAPAKDGGTVSLRRTGALERFVYYVAIGTKLRVSLGVPWAKYQIGRRPVFPHQGGVLPPAYVRTLEATAHDVIRAELGGGGP